MAKEARTAKFEIFICLALTLATLAAYWPVQTHDFVFYDDPDHVTENPQVRAGLTWSGFVWAFKTVHVGDWNPLTWLSHMLDWQLYGLKAGGHHLTNLLLHIVNTLLLFGVLRQMTGAVWRCALVAALFALHPLHVESVAWISERKDVLSTFFFLLTLWAYARYVHKSGIRNPESEIESPRTTPHASIGNRQSAIGNWKWYSLALLFFALGLMSKPMLITLPFVLLLLDYWPLKRFQLSAFSFQLLTFRRLLLEKLPFFLLSGVSIAIAWGVVPQDNSFPLSVRVGNALVSYFRYIRKTFWPDDLTYFYPHPGAWPTWQVIGAGLFLCVISFLSVFWVRRRPYLLVGWLWFLGILVPVIGLVQQGLQSMADRYSYIPLIGVFLAVAWLVSEITITWPHRRLWLASAGAATLLACIGVTRSQLRYWQNSEALCRHALRVTRNNPYAFYDLGNVLFPQGKHEDAIACFREALRLKPNYAPAHNNLGQALLEQGNIEEGVAHLRRALELRPEYHAALNNLAWFMATRREAKYRNGPEAVRLAEHAVQLKKDARILDTLSVAYAETGRFPEAITAAQQALEMAEAIGQKGVAGQIRGRIADFKLGKPYRE